MPAVVTDQFRISNASNFVDSVLDSNNSYYVFLGLANPEVLGFGRTDSWNSGNTNSIPSPTDNLQYLSHYRDTSLFGKKINSANIRRVVKKYSWTANTRYDMYRHDYSIQNADSKTLYNTNYYVVNSDYRVYICLDNGSYGYKGDGTDNYKGKRSLDEPTFTDLEPAAAGTSGDGYIWKYLFSISPSDVIKFDSTEYIVLPNEWAISTDSQIQSVRESGNSDINKNQIKKIYIENPGDGYNGNSADSVVCDILGDGTGGKALVTVNSNGEISDVSVTSGGSGYTYGIVDLSDINAGAFADTPITPAKLIPIIPPSKGHGYNIYPELGADKVLVYARFDDSTKDYPVDTQFAQVGIIKNPSQFNSNSINTSSQFSSLYSIMMNDSISVSDKDSLVGAGISQQIGNDVAKGYIASYDNETKVLKYFQDRSLYFGDNSKSSQTDYRSSNNSKVIGFSPNGGMIKSVEPNASFEVGIKTSFSGITTITSDNKQVNLGVTFTQGLANPEINKKTGEIIYIDNRKMVKRDVRQKEDVKIILEF